MSTLTTKEDAIFIFYSEWINSHVDHWKMIQYAANSGDFMFERVADGDVICDQFTIFLEWLIGSQEQANSESFSGESIIVSQILHDINTKRQALFSNFPEIAPRRCNDNVDYTKQQVYSVYNEFLEFARQIEAFTNMTEDSLMNYRESCKLITEKVSCLRNAVDFSIINESLREVNGKLKWPEISEIGQLKDLKDQLCGWMGDRLFCFEKSIIPSQYLSVDDFFRDVVFQYNFIAARSRVLTRKYSPDVKPLLNSVNDLWNKFRSFYSDVTKLNIQKITYVNNVDLPIRTLFLMGKIPEMIQSIQSVFKDVPSLIYKKNCKMNESHFHIAMHSMFKSLKLEPFSEQATNNGRSDMLINALDQSNRKVLYILEFKKTDDDKNRSDEALRQIKRKDYGLSKKDDYFRIYGLGLCFSTKERNIIGTDFNPVLLYENGTRQYKLRQKKTK